MTKPTLESGSNVLVVGATSGIAVALAHRLAGRGVNLALAGREAESTSQLAGSIGAQHGVRTHALTFDAEDVTHHGHLMEEASAALGGEIEAAVLCFGVMPEEDGEDEFRVASRIVSVNLLGAISLLQHLSVYYQKRGHGIIVGLSSVAGDRGRAQRMVYGTSKAGLTAYLSALRQRMDALAPAVVVTTVKPGPVDTRMTRGVVDAASPLVSSPDRVAKGIERAMIKGRAVAYVPWWWGVVSGLLGLLPERIFKKLRF